MQRRYIKNENLNNGRSGVHRLASRGCVSGDIGSNLRGVRVVVREEEKPYIVVTVYFDRRLR